MLPVGIPGPSGSLSALIAVSQVSRPCRSGRGAGRGQGGDGGAAGGGVVAPQNRLAGAGRAHGGCRWFLLPARGGIPFGGQVQGDSAAQYSVRRVVASLGGRSMARQHQHCARAGR